MRYMRARLTLAIHPAALVAALRGWVPSVIADLRANPQRPLYKSGVRYRRERGEDWLLPSQITTFADCEDLAAWRAAELQLRGIDAQPTIKRTGPRTWHAVVQWPDGRIEDPSKRLGMKEP